VKNTWLIPQRKVHVVKIQQLIEFLESYNDTRPPQPNQIQQIGEVLYQIVAAGTQ